jgi:hypothetical protein
MPESGDEQLARYRANLAHFMGQMDGINQAQKQAYDSLGIQIKVNKGRALKAFSALIRSSASLTEMDLAELKRADPPDNLKTFQSDLISLEELLVQGGNRISVAADSGDADKVTQESQAMLKGVSDGEHKLDGDAKAAGFSGADAVLASG